MSEHYEPLRKPRRKQRTQAEDYAEIQKLTERLAWAIFHYRVKWFGPGEYKTMWVTERPDQSQCRAKHKSYCEEAQEILNDMMKPAILKQREVKRNLIKWLKEKRGEA